MFVAIKHSENLAHWAACITLKQDYRFCIGFHAMKFLRDLSVAKKLIVAFLFVGVIPMVVIGINAVATSEDIIHQQVSNQLAAVRTIKANEVERYFDRVRNQVATLVVRLSVVEMSGGDENFVAEVLMLLAEHAEFETFRTLQCVELTAKKHEKNSLSKRKATRFAVSGEHYTARCAWHQRNIITRALHALNQ